VLVLVMNEPVALEAPIAFYPWLVQRSSIAGCSDRTGSSSQEEGVACLAAPKAVVVVGMLHSQMYQPVAGRDIRDVAAEAVRREIAPVRRTVAVDVEAVVVLPPDIDLLSLRLGREWVISMVQRSSDKKAGV
jgi:hypothetical protein